MEAKTTKGAKVARVATSQGKKAARAEKSAKVAKVAKAEKPEAAKAKAESAKPTKAMCKASNEAIKQAEKAAKVVLDFVSVDDTRVVLKAPYHDHKAKMVVATDGRAMIATKYGYRPDVKDSRAYPDWTKVVPSDKSLCRSLTVEPLEVLKVCANANRLARLTRGNDEEPLMRFTFSDGKSLVFKVENITRVLFAMHVNGIKEIKSNNKGVAIARNADTTIIAMPLHGDKSCYDIKCAKQRKGDCAFIFDVSGVLLQAPESSISENDKVRLVAYRKKRDELGKKELAELATLEKRFEAEAVIDSMLPTAKPQAKPEKPQAQTRPQDDLKAKAAQAVNDCRLFDWMRDISNKIENGRLAEITADVTKRAKEAADKASHEAVLLVAAQAAKLQADSRPRAKRIGDEFARAIADRAKALNVRFAAGDKMDKARLVAGSVVVLQDMKHDRRITRTVDDIIKPLLTFAQEAGKYTILSMAWTVEPEAAKPAKVEKAAKAAKGKKVAK